MNGFIHNVKYSEGLKKLSSHYHDAHQILYVVDGCAEISVDGKNYKLYKDSLIFISQMESHSIVSADEHYSRFEIRISPEISNYSHKNPILYSVLKNRPEGFCHVVTVSDNSIINIFNEMITEFENEKPYKDDMLSILLDRLFISLYRCNPEVFSVGNTPNHEIVYKIQKEFENDMSSNFTLDMIADKYKFNKYYLSHMFKSVTGYSVMDYLKNSRLAKSKYLLAKTALSIGDIVNICGFSDCSNFSRSFKQSVGMSPSEFRKKYK